MTRRNLSDVLRQEVTKDPAEDAAEIEAAPPAKAGRTRKATAPVEDQAAQLDELKAALAQGAEQEKGLQAQVQTLEKTVHQQQQQIDALENQVAQGDSKLKAELAEAREVILQLSQANTEMSKTAEAAKQPKQTPKQTTKPRSSLTVRPLPRHSIQIRPSETTDKPKTIDVGWMD